MKLAALLLAAAVTASGAAATPPKPAITAANYVEIGDGIVDMLDTSGLAFSTLIIGQADDVRPRRAAFAQPPSPPHTEPFDMPCPGGGWISGRMIDRDVSGDVSVNDRFIPIFKSCRIDDEVVTGTSEFTVAAHRDEGAVERTELEFRFTNLGTDALRWSGPARVILRSDRRNGSEHYVVIYRDVAVTRGARSLRWSFTLEMRRPPIGDSTASVDGSMSIGALPLKLSQDEPFVLSAGGTPRSGRLTASDARGNRIQVEATPRRYRYAFFRSGNRGEVPDSTSQSDPHAGR